MTKNRIRLHIYYFEIIPRLHCWVLGILITMKILRTRIFRGAEFWATLGNGHGSKIRGCHFSNADILLTLKSWLQRSSSSMYIIPPIPCYKMQNHKHYYSSLFNRSITITISTIFHHRYHQHLQHHLRHHLLIILVDSVASPASDCHNHPTAAPG